MSFACNLIGRLESGRSHLYTALPEAAGDSCAVSKCGPCQMVPAKNQARRLHLSLSGIWRIRGNGRTHNDSKSRRERRALVLSEAMRRSLLRDP